MAARSTWAGALSLGPLVSIPVKLYAVTNKTAPSFKNLCTCHHQPVKAPKTCATTGAVVDELAKGHEASKGKFVVVPDEAVEAIASQEKSTSLDPKLLTPVSSFPFDLSTAHYSLIADEGPNAEQGVQIIWNGLRANGWVLVAELAMRAGSRDQLVAVYAGDDGLYLNALPWHAALRDAPAIEPEANEQMGDVFAQYASMNEIPVDAFDHASFTSGFEERREAAIAAALSGQPIPAREATEQAEPVPDLMAALTASIAAVDGKPKAKAKKPALKAVA